MDLVWKQTSVQELLDPLLANISEPVWIGYKLDPACLLRFCLNYNNDAFLLLIVPAFFFFFYPHRKN